MLKKIFYIKIPKNRIFGLDLLRAIAIMMVMFAHANGHQPPAFISQYLSPLLIDGVGIFFVLSGFLIGGILIRDFEKEISLRSLLNFWQRRWFRTLPNYLLILITLIILNYFFQMGFTANDYGSYFVFLQNFSSPMGSFFPESWSLSIEEWFYLITPVAIILFYLSFRRKISLKWVLLFVILLIITYSTTLRFYRYLFLELPKGYNTWDLHFMRQVATRLDALMFGVFGAWLKRYYPKIFYFKSLWFLIIGVGLTILLEIINNKMHNNRNQA
ncbi:MAG: acyltransferase [Bergeyella zoohelcum]|nr:acyltransferase [Bergeyella zoohelcum]